MHRSTIPEVVVLVPRLDFSGPVKGALALTLGLSQCGFRVKIVPLKICRCEEDCFLEYEGLVDNSLTEVSWWEKIRHLRSLKNVVLISFCLVPDTLVWLSGKAQRSVCSVRANLYENYIFQFGKVGFILAKFNYFVMRRFHTVVAMSDAMHQQIKREGITSIVIKNFIEERKIDSIRATGHRQKNICLKLAFIGGLTHRKAPNELLSVFVDHPAQFENVSLDFFGDGPLLTELQKCREKNNMDNIRFLGFVENMETKLFDYDVLVLPSYSEGVSRAALEALHAGLRVIMRDVDANSELVPSIQQGSVFVGKEELTSVLKRYSEGNFRRSSESNLPDEFRFDTSVRKYSEVVDEIYAENLG